jgi:hypothetical protein
MLLAHGIVTSTADAFANARLAYVSNAFSARIYNSIDSSATVLGTDATTRTQLASYGVSYDNASVTPRARWRASKGSAPVNRFTRAFGNNQTEGWHLTMPVGIETIVTVLVPAVFLRMLSVAPAVVPGAAPVTAPPTTIRLVANAPAVSQATVVAVPTSRLTLNAIAPARTTTRTLTVPAVAVRDIALAPTVVPGTRTLTPQIGVLRLLAVAPEVQNFILVPAATLRLLAVAPSVTGGGGGGGTVTLRKSGD